MEKNWCFPEMNKKTPPTPTPFFCLQQILGKYKASKCISQPLLQWEVAMHPVLSHRIKTCDASSWLEREMTLVSLSPIPSSLKSDTIPAASKSTYFANLRQHQKSHTNVSFYVLKLLIQLQWLLNSGTFCYVRKLNLSLLNWSYPGFLSLVAIPTSKCNVT